MAGSNRCHDSSTLALTSAISGRQGSNKYWAAEWQPRVAREGRRAHMGRSPGGAARTKRTTGTGTREVRKPRANSAKRSKLPKRQQSGLWKALLGSFILGCICGALQAENSWRGKGILANLALMLGYGIGLLLLMAIIWSLTAMRRKAATMIRPKRGS